MKQIVNIRIFLVCFTIIYHFCSFLSLAQTEADPAGFHPAATKLFQSDDLVELTLSFNMNEVLKDVGDDRIKHDAIITYTDEAGQQISLPIRIRTRGHFRRDPVNCNFPPILLDFPKSETVNTIFEGQNELKLVTHCRSKSKSFEQIVIKEYLVYKIYNLFTEESFRVRLVRILYEDTEGKKDPITQFGFLIEPEEQMADRNGYEIMEIEYVSQERTQQDKMMTLCVFQYFIGNTDWSVPVLHNIILLSKDVQQPPVAVPYDFDWSGMVNAPYAYPAPQLGIENVRQRLFRGFCRPEEEYQPAFDLFLEKKSEIYSLCENFPYLDPRELKGLTNYFNLFYKTIQNPKSVRNEFYLKCRSN
ncbi:MAG: hypothetical protein AMS27_06480 [Bacteroides sp. SM23_62_1]|nr:MAG: hypothetical protein AMS27_06480 [Bacteroides sp. SM23_62_1]